MSKTLPSDATKANCDASTDDPKLALLTDLAVVVDMVNALKAALGTAALLNMGNGVEIETSAVGVSDLLRLKFSALAKSAAYTAATTDRAKMINCTGTWSLAFEACATLGDGWFALVRNVSSGTITLDPNASETIDGATTLALAAGESALVVCNGSALVTVGYSATLTSAGVVAALGYTPRPTSLSLNAIGTYFVGYVDGSGSAASLDSNYPGGDMAYTNSGGTISYAGLTGTWKCVGGDMQSGSGNLKLFLRIS